MTPNVRGLPQQVIDTGVLNDIYSYDANCNVTSITDNQESIATRSMIYTPVDYLETTTGSNLWGTATYGNDAIGNIRSVAISAGPTARNSTINYNAATNRIDSIVTVGITRSYGYDRQGNISSRGSEAYVFDGANRMTSATGKATYVYDGNGRRIAVNKTDGTKLIQVYTQAGLLVFGTSQVGSGSITETRYGYLNDSQVAELGANYVHTDGLRSPVARTNASKTILSRTRYEPYGRTAGGTVGAIGFTGHVNDADTGLVYMQQRYYEPLAGRFLSLDPVLTDANTASSFNRYNYANNSPYKYIDPDGRAVESITVDKNKNVHIVLGIAYKGSVTADQAAKMNGAAAAAWSGKHGEFAVNVTIVPPSQAKLVNYVTVVEGVGHAEGAGIGARTATMYTQDPAGATMQEVLNHEVGHFMGAGDKYFSNGEPKPGYDKNNIMVSSKGGKVEEKNIKEIIEYHKPGSLD